MSLYIKPNSDVEKAYFKFFIDSYMINSNSLYIDSRYLNLIKI